MLSAGRLRKKDDRWVCEQCIRSDTLGELPQLNSIGVAVDLSWNPIAVCGLRLLRRSPAYSGRPLTAVVRLSSNDGSNSNSSNIISGRPLHHQQQQRRQRQQPQSQQPLAARNSGWRQQLQGGNNSRARAPEKGAILKHGAMAQGPAGLLRQSEPWQPQLPAAAGAPV